MKHKTAKTNEWQNRGGIFEIPDGWFVTGVNFDVEKPYVEITQDNTLKERTLLVPKSLAYFLGTHFCGSHVMRELIQEDTKQFMRTKIKEVLGL